MKKLALIAMILLFSFGAFASTASAQYGGCCCKVTISGYVFICDLVWGMTVPGATVKVQGDLGWYFMSHAYTDEEGFYTFTNPQVHLGNYPASWVSAVFNKRVGSDLQSFISYEGASGDFNVACFVLGEPVSVWADIPMWLI